MTSIPKPSSRADVHASKVSNKFVRHESLFLKPCWWHVRMLLVLTKSSTWSRTTVGRKPRIVAASLCWWPSSLWLMFVCCSRRAPAKISYCAGDIANWTRSNRLMLNPDKYEAVWCTSRRQHQLSTATIPIVGVPITTARSVRDLGIILTQTCRCGRTSNEQCHGASLLFARSVE